MTGASTADPGPASAGVEPPAGRVRLLPAISSYVDHLRDSIATVGVPHPEAAEAMADWIASNRRPGEAIGVIVVCTGNSRRSILGSTLGNVAAAYVGLPEVRFSSGGTEPSAFNSRTIDALRAVGIAIESTGSEAPRGAPELANPIAAVRWGDPGDPTMATLEFSKRFDDPINPRAGFAALLVCGEAGGACPAVPGASLRLSIPFDDPMDADGTPVEAARYAERRDDIGRWMLRAMTSARARIGL